MILLSINRDYKINEIQNYRSLAKVGNYNKGELKAKDIHAKLRITEKEKIYTRINLHPPSSETVWKKV